MAQFSRFGPVRIAAPLSIGLPLTRQSSGTAQSCALGALRRFAAPAAPHFYVRHFASNSSASQLPSKNMTKPLTLKRLQKLAKEVTDKEIESLLNALSGHWVMLGDQADEEHGELTAIHIVDNEVFKRFESMQWMEDDEVFAFAKYQYLLKQALPRFRNDEELRKYVNELTTAKYGAQPDA
ncbi:hypothetical protein [Viridibacterium curvum]|uniref:Uncharacterized protein n=1 Tax=Viridibacterium curvum TaxID=1101404 RepID=A0ABP9R0I5_9RHOO